MVRLCSVQTCRGFRCSINMSALLFFLNFRASPPSNVRSICLLNVLSVYFTVPSVPSDRRGGRPGDRPGRHMSHRFWAAPPGHAVHHVGSLDRGASSLPTSCFWAVPLPGGSRGKDQSVLFLARFDIRPIQQEPTDNCERRRSSERSNSMRDNSI